MVGFVEGERRGGAGVVDGVGLDVGMCVGHGCVFCYFVFCPGSFCVGRLGHVSKFVLNRMKGGWGRVQKKI